MIAWLWGLVVIAWSVLVLVVPVQAAPRNIVPLMSGYSVPSGLVSVSSEYGAGNEGWRLFDRDSTSYWISAWGQGSGWVQYDTGGTYYNLLSYAFTAPAGPDLTTSEQQAMPKDWRFLGFGASGWQVLDTVSGQTGWSLGEKRSFTFQDNQGYRAVKLEILSNNGHPGVTLGGEFEVIGDDVAPTPAPSTTPTAAPSGDPSASPSASPDTAGSSGSVELYVPIIQSAEWKPAWDLAGIVLLKGIALAVLVVFFRGLV